MLYNSFIALVALSLGVMATAAPQETYKTCPKSCHTTSTVSTSCSSMTCPKKSTITVSPICSSTTCPKKSTFTVTPTDCPKRSTVTVSPTECPKRSTVTVSPTCSSTTCPKRSTVTVSPTCPTKGCLRSTVTTTSVSTTTIPATTVTETKNITTTVPGGATGTGTPGPVIDLIAYQHKLCAVDPVSRAGDQPAFTEYQLYLPAAVPGQFPYQGTSDCVKTGQNPASFSWDIVSFGAIPADCTVNFYQGDSCFNENNGVTQLGLINGQDACRNIKNVRSVNVVCGGN